MSAAVIKAAPVVLGKKLQPFTLGHQMVLEALESSYAVGSEKPRSPEEDLLISVFVCSLDYKAALVAFSNRWIIRLHNWIWSKRTKKYNLLHEEGVFSAYLNESCVEPFYDITSKEGGTESAVPWLTFLRNKNQEITGMNKDECLSLTYRDAIDTWLAHLDEKGSIRLWNDLDYQMADYAKKKGAAA